VVRGSANVRRLIVLTEVTLTLMLGIATPQAFSHVPGGLPGPAIVVLTYVAVRVLQLAALWIPLRRDTALPTAVIRAAAPTCVAAVLLVGAVLAGGATGPATPLSTALWVAGIAVDLSSGYLTGARNWQLGQVSKWMGRYNLIILIALGQAVISTGMAVAGLPASGPALLCVALGALLLSALWWTYVGTDVVIGERFTELTTPRQRGTLARDAYTYLHLFLVVGLVLVAFGLRTSLAIPGQLGPATPAGTRRCASARPGGSWTPPRCCAGSARRSPRPRASTTPPGSSTTPARSVPSRYATTWPAGSTPDSSPASSPSTG